MGKENQVFVRLIIGHVGVGGSEQSNQNVDEDDGCYEVPSVENDKSERVTEPFRGRIKVRGSVKPNINCAYSQKEIHLPQKSLNKVIDHNTSPPRFSICSVQGI